MISLPQVLPSSRGIALSPTQQLAMLRGLTVPRGQLHEAQVQQLRQWPFWVDPRLATKGGVLAEVDFTGRMVSYTWKSEGKVLRVNEAYLERLHELESGVQFLLGAEWRIAVKRDGVSIYPVDGGGSGVAGAGGKNLLTRLAEWWRS